MLLSKAMIVWQCSSSEITMTLQQQLNYPVSYKWLRITGKVEAEDVWSPSHVLHQNWKLYLSLIEPSVPCCQSLGAPNTVKQRGITMPLLNTEMKSPIPKA